MDKISIVFIAQGNYWSVIHSFQSLGFKIKEKETELLDEEAPVEFIKTIGDIEVELFVADLTGDVRTRDYFNPLATHVEVDIIQGENTLSKIYNKLFRRATAEYICIIQSGLFLQESWAESLVYHYENIDKSGVVGIVNNSKDARYLSLLSSDGETMVNVFSPEKISDSKIAFFSRQHLYMIGAFDESIHLEGNEIAQFARRHELRGNYNYNIPSETVVFNSDPNVSVDISYSEISSSNISLESTLSEMLKAGNCYIPL